jgi:hypothetical protein
MTRQLTPQELAGLLAQRIPGSYRIGQTTGANPGQSIQIDGVAAVARSVIPPGRAVAVNVGGQWQAYPEPALAAPSERIVTSVRRRPRVEEKQSNAVVFYSFETGNKREFWLKSARYNLKVLEIDRTYPYTPWISLGDVGSSATFSVGGFHTWASGTGSSAAFTSGAVSVRVPAGSVSARVDQTAYYGSGVGSVTVIGGSGGNAQASNPVVSGVRFFNITPGVGEQFKCATFFGIELVVRSFFFGGTVSGSGTATWTVTSISPGTRTNSYEAGIAVASKTVFLIIKEQREVPRCGIQEDPPEEYQKVHLITVSKGGSFSKTTFEYDEAVTPRANNWRNFQENYAKAEDSSSDNPCFDAEKIGNAANFEAGFKTSVVFGPNTLNDIKNSTGTVSTQFTKSQFEVVISACETTEVGTQNLKVPAINKPSATIEGVMVTL